MARLMKDSGIGWIGKIPVAWRLQRLKNCIASRESGDWGEEPTGEVGDSICLRIADFDYSRFRFKDNDIDTLTQRHYPQDIIEKLTLQTNDILIEKSGGGEKTPVGRTVVFDKPYKALFANFMDRLRCVPDVDPMFLQYVFVTFYKNDYTRNYIKQTTGLQNLDLRAMLSEILIPFPESAEQRRIAAYLDAECARIDSVIEKTRASIEEYKKLKQSVITEAVTKGIRKGRAMKESGIAWIGMVPDDWGVFRLKDYYSFEKGKNAAKYTQEYIGQHGGVYPVYSGQTENDGVMGLIDTYDYLVDECLFTTTVGAKVMTPKILSGKFHYLKIA